MIAQVAALFERAGASWVFTFEEKLDALGVGVFYFDSLMPLVWNPFKVFHFEVVLRFDPVFMVHVFIFMRVIRFIIVHALLHLNFLRLRFRISWIPCLLHWMLWMEWFFRQEFSFLLGKLVCIFPSFLHVLLQRRSRSLCFLSLGTTFSEQVVQFAKFFQLLGS